MARSTIKPAAKSATQLAKQKRGQPANIFNKQAKNSWTEFDFLLYFLNNEEKVSSWGFMWFLLTFSFILKAWLDIHLLSRES